MPIDSNLDLTAIQANKNTRSRAYWRSRLEGFEPFRYFSDPGFSPGEWESGDLRRRFRTPAPPGLGEAIKELAGTDRARHVVLLAALGIFAQKYSGLDDVCIFTPLPAAEMTQGPIPVRIGGLREMDFMRVLMQVRDDLLADMAHADYPLEKIVHTQEATARQWPVTGMIMREMTIGGTFELLPPDLLFCFGSEDLSLEIVHNGEQFGPEHIMRLARLFYDLLGRLVENKGTAVGRIRLIDDRDAERLVYGYNATSRRFEGAATVLSRFEEQAAQKASRPAITVGRRELDYGSLDRLAGRIGAFLKAYAALQPGELVGVMLERDEYLVASLLGIWKAGAAFVPIDPGTPPERIRAIAGDAGIRIVLCRAEQMAAMFTVAIDPDTHLAAIDASVPLTGTITDPTDTAYVIYTSGSTGTPKGVRITHATLNNYVCWAADTYVKEEEAGFACFTSIAFDLTLTSIFVPLITGNIIYIYPEEGEGSPLERVLQDNRCALIKLTPSHLTLLKDSEYLRFFASQSRIKRFIIGGEALTSRLAAEIHELFDGAVELFNEYGPTEATIGCMIHRYDGEKDKGRAVPIGRPIANSRIYLLDRALDPVPVGVPGELYISGDVLATGYLNREELTRERFIPDPFQPLSVMYKTGDRGWWSTGNLLSYLGRTDEQVKIRGYRVELGEIEAQLRAYPEVEEAVVLVRRGGASARLVAFLVTGPGLSVDGLRDFLRQRLPDYMLPEELFRIDSVPLTANGKVDQAALLAMEAVPVQHYAPAETALERLLVAQWEKILETAPVGIDDDFFNAGGDSILSVRLLGWLNKELNVKITMADFLRNRSIRLLAALIDNAAGKEKTLADDPADRMIDEFARGYYRNGWPDTVEAVFPMSDIEKGLFFVHLTRAADVLYLGQSLIPIDHAGFDVETLRMAMRLLVRKHPILRTAFDLKEYAHIVYKDPAWEIPLTDGSGWTGEEQRSHIASQMAKGRIEHFKPGVAPLWRMAVYKLSPNAHVLLFEAHHAILDGWSSASLITELNNTYVAIVREKGYQAGELKTGYRDYIREELAQKHNGGLADFWKRTLAGFKKLQLPPGEKQRTYVTVERMYSSELAEKVRRGAVLANTVPRTILFAAYVYSLKMLTYQNDLVVGYVSFNRPLQEDGDRLLGCFVNTLPVRIHIGNDMTWAGYIRETDRVLSAALGHGALSLFEISRIAGGADRNENPFFDTLFNFMDFHILNTLEPLEKAGGEEAADGWHDNFIRGHTLLDVNMSILDGGIRARYDVAADLLTGEMFDRWLGYYEKLIGLLAESPHGPADMRLVLDAAETQRLLYDLNTTQAAFPGDTGLTELFLKTCRERPQGRAVSAGNETITYGLLESWTAAIARVIRSKGISGNSVIGIVAERSLEMVAGILGIIRAGCAYLPIDPASPIERNRQMLLDVDAELLLCQQRFASDCRGICELAFLEVMDAPPGREEDGAIRTAPHDAAYVIFTSGSTGRPKGVLVPHRAVVNRLHWMQKAYPIGPDDVILQKTPFSFDVSVWELFWWSQQGAQLVMLKPGGEKDPGAIIDAIERHGVTVIHFVPAMLQVFLDYWQTNDTAGRKLDTLHYVFASGEALMPKTVERFNELVKARCPRVRLINLYGPTEATVDVTWYDCPADGPVGSIPIGKPIDNIRLSIVDENLQLLPPGIAGELCIAGVGLAKGYLNRPELTKEKFIGKGPDRRYRTGDLARWLPDGNVQYLGRIDAQVKIRGYRIEPGEVEHALLRLPGIREAAVIAGDYRGEIELTAYYTGTEDLDELQLKTLLRSYLPDHMIPSRLLHIGKMPVNPNGKLDRNRLPIIHPAPHRPAEEGRGEPETALEKGIARLWMDELGVDSIGYEDNFFDLGGHSLSVIRLAMKMKDQFGIEPEFDELLTGTFREFAAGYASRLQESE